MTEDSVLIIGSGADEGDEPDLIDVASDGASDGDTLTVGDRGDGGTVSTGAGRQRRRRWWAIGGAGVVGAVAVAALFLIQLPYFVIQPGSVTPSEQRIHIDGTESFETPGKVMFVTVFVNRATPALIIRSRLDSAVQVRSEEEMFPDTSEDESRQRNVVLMDDSKLIASKVALDYLGIPAEFTGRGALVAGLVEESPSKGSLKAGDVITSVDGADVRMPSDIGVALDTHDPGDTVSIVVSESPSSVASGGRGTIQNTSKGKRSRRVEVALGADPEDPGRPVLGIYVEPFEMSVDSSVDIDVDSGDVSGPSAGLAWTLGIIDRLTPGSLTNGRRVAVTGEIHPDGSVGAVGGTPQKAAAVKRAGIKVFLYPASTPKANQAEIKRIAGDDMSVHAVATIDEAVRILAPEGVTRP